MARSMSATSMTILQFPSPPPALYVAYVSGALKEMVSTIFSKTVCKRRAPMLSTDRFTSAAMSATCSTAASVKLRSTPSVSMSAFCCISTLVTGSVIMRSRSSRVRPLRFTLTGKRPCNSASISLGFTLWKAPEAMNKIWSVLMLPYLPHVTMLPSMMGSKSRCTPSHDASGPDLESFELTILSISSRNTIPSFSAARTASF
mmetsp:Transcript_28226/g.45241  ORF Transcript_28226/g.45241 Transcript_28226/m.45241 type:complete len:202 (-) Transcript_28226:1170-1775(-)